MRASTWVAAASRPKNNAASCSSNALSPRYGEPVTVPGGVIPRAASTSAAGALPRAAATNSSRTGPARFSASASSSAVSLRAVRLMPRSRSLIDRGLRPAACASSSWVSRASARSCRSSPAKVSVGYSATAHRPLANAQPAATHRNAG